MQVRLSGFTAESRYVVACNGRRVPLHLTGRPGEAVAAVRYCARRLSAVFHPTVPVHAPLVFDLIDLWNHRSIGRCTYHFGAPDGGTYTARPANAAAAERRRQERFQKAEGMRDLVSPGERNQFDLSNDSGLAAAGARKQDELRQAGAGPLTTDLYQTLLRYRTGYDETSADGINPRPHWAHMMESLRAIGPEELGRRWSRAEHRIRENGITYNVYSDPLGASRAWGIDIVPLLIPADEWRFIEAGITQRAQLLSRILEDLYGTQDLVAQGHFPAALLYANPAFLRPLAGVRVPAHSYLHMLAVDLARSPDGQWWVLADRTQAPSGSGYALENRTIISDVLPDLFRASNVLRLAPFFRAQREALINLAQCENPRIVLLTPGPYNETYFEHSYLARYLSLTLVEGADLTVRDRRVYLKTVDGLEQVDVILRRVDDSYCDPLELRGDSLLGVAGFVDAIVAGNVQVANALGSGLIETAAIMPFLPGLCRKLLGEDLKLPSVATWWCGQEAALDSCIPTPRFSGCKAVVSIKRHGTHLRVRTLATGKSQVCRTIAGAPA